MRLNEIYERFKDDVQIFCIYIQEAHPTDGWQVPQNVNEKVLFAQPTTIEEREEAAAACMLHMAFDMPMMLDNMTNQVDEAYCALPERLYVLDADGRIAFRTAMGPWGFDVKAWEAALEEITA